MSKISLRAYTREIDSLVDQNRLDEAIAHCRHILSKFPKHIDTYRLLGKAYLEDNKNSNAADIFQRVLSAVPDDFVSHIGMSLIREEEGNLTSALTHMERAFEKQPYNNAIQEEIRRLYGKRDDVEPAKVRLTQGALARMYLKGGLVSQGIAELRSAISEQPQRFDLRTLLAQAYQEAGKMGKAIETASVILKKFPFNLTANRILAQTLKSHDHPEEMAICRKRLYALDPYEAYVSEHAPAASDVPDQAITLERLDSAQIPEDYQDLSGTDIAWETALGSEASQEADEEEPVPDWLAGMPEGEPAQEGMAEAPPSAQQEEPAGDKAGEPIPQEEISHEEEPSEEFEEEPVPDWLAGMPEGEPAQEEMAEAPPSAQQEEPAGDEAGEPFPQEEISHEEEPSEEFEEEPVPDWLAGMPEGEPAQEEMAEAPPSAQQEEPEGDEAGEPFPQEEISHEEEPSEEFEEEPAPDWLAEISGEESYDIASDTPTQEDVTDEGIPSRGEVEDVPQEDIPGKEPSVKEKPRERLEAEGEVDDLPSERDQPSDISDEKPIEEDRAKEESKDIPGWMEDAGWQTSDEVPGEPQDIYGDVEDQEGDELEPAEIPDWLQEKSPRDSGEPTSLSEFEEEERETSAPDMEDKHIPDWFAEEETSGQEPQKPEKSTPLPPVQEEQARDVEREVTDISPEDLESDFGDEDAEDFPDWLKDIKSDEEEQETTVAWLNNFTSDTPPADADYISSDQSQESPADLEEPDWIQEISKERSAKPPKEEEEIVKGEGHPQDIPLELDEDESLEPVAEEDQDDVMESDPISDFEQGEGLVSEQISDDEDFPAWLEELDDQEEDIVSDALPSDVPGDIETPSPEEEISSHEEDQEMDIPLEPSMEEVGDDEGLPSWLTEVDEEIESEEADRIERVEPEDISEDEDLRPSDFQRVEDEVDDVLETLPADEEDLEPVSAETDKDDTAAPDVEDEDATLAWLESLAEKQGADEEEFVTSAEERAQAQAPEREETTEEAPTPEKEDVPLEEDLPKAEMPDWLADLEPEEEISEEEDFPLDQETAEGFEEDIKDIDIEEQEEGLPGWLDEADQAGEEVFDEFEGEDIAPQQEEIQEPAPESPVEDLEEPAVEESIPDWLGELEQADEVEEDQPPEITEDRKEPTTPPDLTAAGEEQDKLDFPDAEDMDEEKDMAWLESLAEEDFETDEDLGPEEEISQVQIPEIEEEPAEPAEPAEPVEEVEDFVSAEPEDEDDELPGWLAELEDRDVDQEGEVFSPSEGQAPDDVVGEIEEDEESLDWLADFEEAEEEAKDFLEPEGELEEEVPTERPFLEEEETPERPPSEGMLKRLGEIEQEVQEEEQEEEIPDWLADFKEEEDPQETAVLWLRRYVEGGGDIDLEKELKAYTDSLETDEIPEWVEDLQEDDDPTSTAMLWLERLEEEEAFRDEEEQRRREESKDSDWLAELEKEQKLEDKPAPSTEASRDFDMDEEGWLADLEQEDQPDVKDTEKSPEGPASEEKEADEVPPWMLATSPLEGDLLTGDLMEESEEEGDEEEIPEWLAGYEEEEEVLTEEELGPEPDEEEYAWLSAYEEGAAEPKQKIDLNNAPISQLESLIGISFQIAKGIVTHREEHGPFSSFEELRNVPAIQEKQVLEILREETMIAPSEVVSQEADKVEEKEPEAPPEPAVPSQDPLQDARAKMSSGSIDEALQVYDKLIDKSENIDQVIDDLSEASYDHPMNVPIIKTLGDAYMSADMLQEALDAYSKAEDLLR